ncbi:MAG: hypothetical protein HY763_12460 [Planctomycetes bacterium]|nr:hypothetical protein [Planctomycetota bacterium]
MPASDSVPPGQTEVGGKMRRPWYCAIVITLAAASGAAAGPGSVYWTKPDIRKIQRQTPNAVIEDLVSSLVGSPEKLALDPPRGRMYWLDGTDRAIHRANLDGSSIITLPTQGFSIVSFDVQVTQAAIYWMGSRNGEWGIFRSDLDGAGLHGVVAVSPGSTDLALDLFNGKVYWATAAGDAEDGIRRANIDGFVEEVVLGPSVSPKRLAVDGLGRRVCFTTVDSDTIRPVDFDGSSLVALPVATSGALTVDVPTSQLYGVASSAGESTIFRTNLDGLLYGTVQTLPDNDATVWGLGVHSGAGKVYWTATPTAPAPRRVDRANLDGSGTETLAQDLIGEPWSLAVVPESGKIYFSDPGLGTLLESDLSGAGVQAVITGAPGGFYGVAVDAADGMVYWSDLAAGATCDGRIWRRSLSGTGPVQLVLAGLGRQSGECFPVSIAVDPLTQTVYWADPGSRSVGRVGGDGAGNEVLYTSANGEPWGVALDLAGQRVYWTLNLGVSTFGRVLRSRFDGSELETILTLSLGTYGPPLGIALDTTLQYIYISTATGRVARAAFDGSGATLVADTGGAAVPSVAVAPSTTVPSLGSWGVAVLALLVLTAGTLLLRPRPACG